MAVHLSECSYERVVIYSDCSECKRIIDFDVKVGENDIMVCGLPHSIDSESIRVEGKSTFPIKDKCGPQPIINDVIYFDSFDLTKIISVNDTYSMNDLSLLSEEISSFQKELNILKCKMKISKSKMATLTNLSSFLDLNAHNSKKPSIDNQLNTSKFRIPKITGEENSSFVPELADQSSYTLSANVFFQDFENLSLKYLSNYLTFFSHNLFHLQDVVNTLTNEISSITNRIEALELNRKRLISSNKFDKSDKFCKAIKIIVDSKEECSITLALTYICSNASWKPFYQLSFCTEKNELELFYYGIVQQGTGENWKNCPISLSTSSPLFGKPPILYPQTISVLFQSQLQLQRASSITGLMGHFNEVYNNDDNFQNMVQDMPQNDLIQGDFKHPDRNIVFTHTFMASRPTSIPSNNTEHKVSLALIKVIPNFQHISQPERNSNVYLQANVTNSSEFPLLAGCCSVFLDGNFLSKTNLSNVSPQEPFSLSLGADSQVKVVYFNGHKHRKRQQGLFAKANISTYEFKKYFDVRNHRTSESRIIVRHCLPLSQDERVKVTLLEPHLKKQDSPLKIQPYVEVKLSSLNIVEWTLQLQPNEFEKLILKYQIEYPYGMSLAGQD